MATLNLQTLATCCGHSATTPQSCSFRCVGTDSVIGLIPTCTDGYRLMHQSAQELLSQVDSGMGKLSFSEVNTAASSFQADGDYAQQIKDAFKVFDKDGKGSLAASELTHIMCNLGEKMTQQEVEEMLKEAGLNGSSAVSQDDFIRIMLAAP
eukprot:TRINITY_DN9709_c0_g1_i5.p1 TRINITY_DN9709_c0_g1~~TRINITY_DN9709_c0_g1_i5.p1  ORF type:complete len:152 (+),score=40.49 TRINITY_DN9709_c0_g1_i5:191-646(+)